MEHWGENGDWQGVLQTFLQGGLPKNKSNYIYSLGYLIYLLGLQLMRIHIKDC